MTAHGSMLTSYGLIERKDGQPVQAPSRTSRKEG